MSQEEIKPETLPEIISVPESKPEMVIPMDKVEAPIEATAQKKSLIMKLASVMAGLGWVEKRGKNTHFNYKYATESDILDAIRRPLGERHIFVQSILDSVEKEDTGRTEGQYKTKVMRTIVHTRYIFHDGESGETLTVNGYGVGEDTADKGFLKSLTAAMKGAMSKNFLISSGDDPEKEDSDEDKPDNTERKDKGISRASSANPTPNNGAYFFDDAIVDTSMKSGGAGKNAWTRYGIKTIKNGWVSTFDPICAEAAQKLQGAGFICRFNVAKENNYVNLISFSELDPDGNVTKHYEGK